ncbi:MAG: AbrB/MazE/SpoVT family DNA-binding domain-containing protein, partial [Patescibacteria group bacterium]|nr:AbrB/MazE/SpoVT family DNA-binding domain-containing protein [Patescibacteria group bacterium]
LCPQDLADKGGDMETTVVTTKGQIVIPSKIRRRYGIKKGTRVCLIEQGGDIVIRPITDEYIEKMAGSLGTKGRVLKTFLEEKKREREL